jgi:urease alpha subunit
MKKVIGVTAITIIASVTATTAATLIAGNVGSATASTATSSSSVATRQLQVLNSINQSLKNLSQTLVARRSWRNPLMEEIEAINNALGSEETVFGGSGNTVRNLLWRIANK